MVPRSNSMPRCSRAALSSTASRVVSDATKRRATRASFSGLRAPAAARVFRVSQPCGNEIASSSRWLACELALIRPTPVASLGFFATRLLFARCGLAPPPKAEFSNLCGQRVAVGDAILLPLQHPAAVLYNPAIQPVLVRNYRLLGEIFADLIKTPKRTRPHDDPPPENSN